MQWQGSLKPAAVLMLAGLASLDALAVEHEFKAKVVAVIDGDTVRIEHDGQGEIVCLLNIDAPELAQPYGERAKDYCKQLCLGDQVRVVWEQRDQQGAKLATIHEEDGFNVNFEMIKAGMAWDALTHDRVFADLEADARRAKRGLWADRHPTPPWEFRKKHPKSPLGSAIRAVNQGVQTRQGSLTW